jgi:hypothetical protein
MAFALFVCCAFLLGWQSGLLGRNVASRSGEVFSVTTSEGLCFDSCSDVGIGRSSEETSDKGETSLSKRFQNISSSDVSS